MDPKKEKGLRSLINQRSGLRDPTERARQAAFEALSNPRHRPPPPPPAPAGRVRQPPSPVARPQLPLPPEPVPQLLPTPEPVQATTSSSPLPPSQTATSSTFPVIIASPASLPTPPQTPLQDEKVKDSTEAKESSEEERNCFSSSLHSDFSIDSIPPGFCNVLLEQFEIQHITGHEASTDLVQDNSEINRNLPPWSLGKKPPPPSSSTNGCSPQSSLPPSSTAPAPAPPPMPLLDEMVKESAEAKETLAETLNCLPSQKPGDFSIDSIPPGLWDMLSEERDSEHNRIRGFS